MEKGNYTAEDKEFMCITSKACNKSRLAELISFIKLNGYRKIGVAYCFSVKAFAEKLIEFFAAEGIDAVFVNCKESGLMGCELSPELSGASCDPKSQAQYLNAEQTDFYINFGLCLGHGILFQKYSAAPVTTLLVKDACHKHNIMENFV